jgi:hypothetical protein
VRFFGRLVIALSHWLGDVMYRWMSGMDEATLVVLGFIGLYAGALAILLFIAHVMR